MINVLIVEDSPVARKLLEHIIGSEPALHVMGTANDGLEALAFLARHKPDVITMDVDMPKMDGLEATRRIMESPQPVPIVMVSAAYAPQEVALTFRALEAGALAAVEKPRGPGHEDSEALARKLVQTVKAMSEVRVVRRWARQPAEVGKSEAKVASPVPFVAPRHKIEVVAIGVSTGGPPVLETILSRLPQDFAAPVLIVQHIAAGFLPGLVSWLMQVTKFPVRIAVQGEALLAGHAYLAPDGHHMGVAGRHISLDAAAPENGLRPAVSYLFRSVAQVFGANAAGVLLTGMGRDGADELKLMKDKGAVTIAQDAASSVVHGMPGEAIKLGAAIHILPPDKVAALLVGLVNRKSI